MARSPYVPLLSLAAAAAVALAGSVARALSWSFSLPLAPLIRLRGFFTSGGFS